MKIARLTELMAAYESALAKHGLSYGTRLNLLARANMIVRAHEYEGAEYLDHVIVANLFCGIEKRFQNEVMTEKSCIKMKREIGRFLHFAKTGGVKLPNPRSGATQTLLPYYGQIATEYLSCDMLPNTKRNARWVTYMYFAWLAEQGHEDLSCVGAEQIQRFLLDCSGKMAVSSIHDVKLHLSKLYKHLYESGLSQSTYAALLSFKVNRESKVRPIMPREEIAKLIDGIDRKTPTGSRNHVIILLGAVLGLRACDVANLKFSDIDWVNGEIKILQSKTSETVCLPLTKDVGEALKDYILNKRPKTAGQHVFVRIHAPHKAFRSAVTVGNIFEDCCKVAGLDYGKQFHILRRSLGTSLVNTGTPVTTVSQILGHTDMDSAKKYIAVDSEHLKLCALPFDGIVPIGGSAL